MDLRVTQVDNTPHTIFHYVCHCASEFHTALKPPGLPSFDFIWGGLNLLKTNKHTSTRHCLFGHSSNLIFQESSLQAIISVTGAQISPFFSEDWSQPQTMDGSNGMERSLSYHDHILRLPPENVVMEWALQWNVVIITVGDKCLKAWGEGVVVKFDRCTPNIWILCIFESVHQSYPQYLVNVPTAVPVIYN